MYKKYLLLTVMAFSLHVGKSQHFFNGEKENRVHSSEDNTPTSIHIIDLDGDGDPDMLSSTGEDDRIVWYENVDGQGNYGPQQTLTASAVKARAVSSADLDGDGDPDVLSASAGDSTVTWYENTDGQGTFGPRQTITRSAGGLQNVSSSDMDGDGDQDVVVSFHRYITWYENTNGHGSFGIKQALSPESLGDSLKTWRRYTFPGPRHKASPDFPPYQGSDRSEYMTFFKVSPADPTFMFAGHNMSVPHISTNGREFRPVELSFHFFSYNAGFSPHDKNTGFLLHDDHSASAIDGIWRTKNRGKSWEQIYQSEPDAPGIRLSVGKQPILVDPHPDRSGHIYFAAREKGLLRSLDNGATWQVAAFEGKAVKTMDAAKGPDDKTILYAVVAEEGVFFGARYLIEEGKLYRVEIEPDPPHQLSLTALPWEGDFVDVEVANDDWSRGLVIRNNNWDRGGGTKLMRFFQGGEKLSSPRTASEVGIRAFMDIHINPLNTDHVVVRGHGGSLANVLHYSKDGGQSWNDPYKVVNGHIPAMISYNPAHHTAPGGAMRNNFQQGQGPAIGFDARNPKVVYWWTQNFDKTPLKSKDYGATWKPFAYGGPFKQTTQIAIGTNNQHMGVSKAEYGFSTTRNGGLSWTGITPETDYLLGEETERGSSTDGPQHKFGWGLAINPGDPNVMVGIFGRFHALFISHDGGLTWEDTGEESDGAGSVYHSSANPSVVYAGNQKSSDKGMTWKSMDRFVLAVSPINEQVLVGNPSAGDPQLSLSINGGQSWKDLPAVPKENFPGTNISRPPLKPQLTTGMQTAHAVAIDPSPQHDPTKTDNQGVRILAAGRSGIYEYTAESNDPYNGSWKILNNGIEPSMHFSKVEPVPWIGHVAFDPRPGMEHVVYACKSADPVMCRSWRSEQNPNMVNSNAQARQPLYRSLDGGRTWNKLHGPEYTGIPNYLDVTALKVGPDGTLYVDGYCGIYALPGVPQE